MSPDRKDSTAPFWCAMLLAAAVAYPASLGPWVYADSRFDLPAPIVTVGERFYQPLGTVVEHVLPEGIASWYLTYLYWWMALSGHPNHC